MLNRNIWFNIASGNNSNQPGLKPNTNKLQRFNVVVPWFKAGKMYFPDDFRIHPAMIEMMEELKLAARGGFKSKHDDALDTVSMLALMLTFKPSESGLSLEKDSIYYVDDSSSGNTSSYNSYIV